MGDLDHVIGRAEMIDRGRPKRTRRRLARVQAEHEGIMTIADRYRVTLCRVNRVRAVAKANNVICSRDHRVSAIAESYCASISRTDGVAAVAELDRAIRSRDHRIHAVTGTDGLVLQKAPIEKHRALSRCKCVPRRARY